METNEEMPIPTETTSGEPPIGLKHLIAIWLYSRCLIAFLLVLASSFSFFEIPAREGKNFNPSIHVAQAPVLENLRRILSSADASWYFEISETGYHAGPSTRAEPKNWVFFPLYPLIIKALNSFTQSSIRSGLLISNVAFLAALILFAKLLQLWSVSSANVKRALWLLCLFPTSYFFSVPMTESLFLLLLVSSWYLLEQKRPILGGLTFALLSACRPTGLILLPAFATLIWEKSALSRTERLAALTIAPLGAIIYILYLYFKVGDPFAFSYNQDAWGRNKQSIIELFHYTFTNPTHLMMPWNFVALNAAAAILCFTASISLFRTKRYSLALLVFLPPAVAMMTGTFQSIGRFSMVLFPLFVVLAQWLRHEFLERAVLALFASALAAMVIMYAWHFTAAMA